LDKKHSDRRTVHEDDDDRDDRDQLSMFSRAGQLALPGATAQLGLDGAAYALENSDRSPERASSSLGPHTEFSTAEAEHPTARSLPGQLQLGLDLKAWDQAPQLSLWQRLDVVRDLVRDGDFDRDSKCNRTRFAAKSDVQIARSSRGSWSTAGTIKCHQWQTCPSCGPQKCREVASKLSVCLDRHMQLAAEHDVWMLTLTIPHDVDERAESTVDHLYDADALLLRSRAWREWCERWGVVGRVRVLDATHGGVHGSHPHFHVAVFVAKAGLPTAHAYALDPPTRCSACAATDAEHCPHATAWVVDGRGGEFRDGVRVMPQLLRDDLDRYGVWKPLRACSKRARERYLDEIKGSLVDAWEQAVRASGARIERPTEFRRKAIELTPSENAAAYFVKWGLADEVGSSTSKARNHLRLLDAVAAGVKGAAYTWKQWRRAVHQHALVTGLTRLTTRLAITDEDAQKWLDEQRRRREAELEREGKPVQLVPELQLVVRAHLYEAAMRLGWDQVFSFVDERASVGRGETSDWLQRSLDDFLWSNLAVSSGCDSS
jgi:hypothetical protein